MSLAMQAVYATDREAVNALCLVDIAPMQHVAAQQHCGCGSK